MKNPAKITLSIICFVAGLCLAWSVALAYTPSTGHRGLDDRLDAVNAYAAKNMDAFVAGLSATYHVDEQAIRDSLARGLQPADVYMELRLGKLTGQPAAEVEKRYLTNPGKGWGVIAMGLGVKPGTSAFRSLKSGADESIDKGKSMASGKAKAAGDKSNAGGSGKGSGKGGGKGGNGGGKGK